MEEFQDLLEPDLVSLMKESMYNATVGDGYRVGGVHDDNCETSVFVFHAALYTETSMS